jgi:putative ABC transport system permease protein
MNFIDLLLTASSSMLRSKARTLLTIVAIFIGAMTITLTNGIGTGVKSYINRQIGNLGATNVLFVTLASNNQSSTNGPPAKYTYNPNTSISSGGFGSGNQLLMNMNDLGTIKSIPNITSAVPAHSFAPDYILGTGDKYQLSLAQQFGSVSAAMTAGTGVNNSSSQNQISIPQNYVGPLGYGSSQSIIGKKVTLGITSGKGAITTVVATVTGVQEKNVIGKSTAYANNSLSDQLNNIQNEGIPAAVADTFQTAYATFPRNLTTAQVTTIKNRLTADGFSAETIKDEENTIFTAVNIIIIVFDLFGAIALLAASFGIINTLYMSVQERTKEIGLMKALGMSPRRIFTLFSIEAVLIGFWGSALGVGCAALIGKLINTIGKHGFLKNFPGLSLLTFPLSTVAHVVLGIMLIAFLAGTLPALRASRKNPIEALRYE